MTAKGTELQTDAMEDISLISKIMLWFYGCLTIDGNMVSFQEV